MTTPTPEAIEAAEDALTPWIISGALSRAIATAALSAAYPLIEAQAKGAAWDEGVATALNHAILNEDGITLRLEHLDGRPWANPYSAANIAPDVTP